MMNDVIKAFEETHGKLRDCVDGQGKALWYAALGSFYLGWLARPGDDTNRDREPHAEIVQKWEDFCTIYNLPNHVRNPVIYAYRYGTRGETPGTFKLLLERFRLGSIAIRNVGRYRIWLVQQALKEMGAKENPPA